MDCPPKKMAVVERLPLVEFGCSYESAFSQSSDFLIKFQILSLLLFSRKYITLTIWTENQAVYLLSEACNRFLIHSSIQSF